MDGDAWTTEVEDYRWFGVWMIDACWIYFMSQQVIDGSSFYARYFAKLSDSQKIENLTECGNFWIIL